MTETLTPEELQPELTTLRQRAERAEDDLREYRNLCEVLVEGNRCSIKLASDLLVAESTIADLTAQVANLKRDAGRWRHWLEYVKHDTVSAQAMVWKANGSRTTFKKLVDAAIAALGDAS